MKDKENNKESVKGKLRGKDTGEKLLSPRYAEGSRENSWEKTLMETKDLGISMTILSIVVAIEDVTKTRVSP